MKLFKKLRKGFTLIELVVVIAVIAVLAAVSVVSYIAITNNAKKSNDQHLIDQVNLSLQAAEITKKPATMHEALETVEEDGYKPANFKTEYKGQGYEFGYNLEKNRFVIINKGSVTYPKDMGPEGGKTFQIWKFADAAGAFNDGFSYYLRPNASGSTITAKAGVDVGYNTGISSVSYTSSVAQDKVIIRTYGGNLAINAADCHVEHYGLLKEGTISAISDSTYVEHGTVSRLVISAQAQSVVIDHNAMVYSVKNDSENFVIKSTAYVGTIEAESAQQPKSGSVNTDGIILVSTADQLQSMALADQVGISLAGKTIKLQNDIDLKGRSWIPFGYSGSTPFSGTIDGSNKKILNLSQFDLSGVDVFTTNTGISGKPAALVAFAKGNVAIKNLTVECQISEPDAVHVSAFIGVYNNLGNFGGASGVQTFTVSLENCTAKGSISGKHKVAGFIGSTYMTETKNKPPKPDTGSSMNIVYSLTNCHNEANIVGQDNRTGGFIGTHAYKVTEAASNSPLHHSMAITFTNCSNSGSVTYGSSNGGAIIGWIASGDTSYGSVTLDLSDASNTKTGLQKVGVKDDAASYVTVVVE